jgi:hypothetical protein
MRHRLSYANVMATPLIVGVVALVCAITGVSAAPGSTSRQAAHPRVGKVVAKVRIPARPRRPCGRRRGGLGSERQRPDADTRRSWSERDRGEHQHQARHGVCRGAAGMR